jgi:hypothetical protein
LTVFQRLGVRYDRVLLVAALLLGNAYEQGSVSKALSSVSQIAPNSKNSARSTPSGIPVPANAWTTFATNGFPAEIVGYDATVYARAIKRHVVLGKYHHYGSEPNYCMDGWSWDENRWDILDCGGDFHNEHSMEGGHPVGAFVYMPNRTSILYWGGQSGSNQPEQAFHTWWWDVQGRTGRDKISATRPGLIKVSSMAYDELADRAVFYPDATFRAEIYDPVSNRWSVPETSGSPPPRGLTFPTLEWNSKDHKTYLFGGASGNSCATGLKFNSDVYTFDLADNRWSKLEIAPDPVNGSPVGRWYTGFAYDPDHDFFLMAGGQQCSGKTPIGLLDTWKLDPEAKQWTKLTPTKDYTVREPSGAPFQKLKYDADHHAFVMILTSFDNKASVGGTWGNYPARVWVFCYSGPCPNVGSQPSGAESPGDSLNRNTGQPISAFNQTWASDTAIATDNEKIFGGWIETGLPFTGGCFFHHPYVQSLAGSSWIALGSSCTAMDAKAASVERDAEKLSLTVASGTLWASWSEANDFVPAVLAKYWNGSAWIGGPIGKRNQKGFQGFSQIISASGIPTIAFIENNRGVFPDITEAFIDRYDGNSWIPLGDKLNQHANGRVESLAITADGKTTWACWTESTISGWSMVGPGQLYCSSWDGVRWRPHEHALNNSTDDWVQDTAAASRNGHLYVAWTERTTAGNAILYVKSWDGSKWSPLGGPANRNPSTGWVFHPRLAADDERLYMSWEEQLELGKPSELYVSQWDGHSWSALGTALNVDPAEGTASHSSMALRQHNPIVLWNEVRLGELQQTHGKQWNGSAWVPLPGRAQSASETQR